MKDKKLFHDTVWNSLDYASTIFIFILVTRFVITDLGVAAYGFYAFFTSLIGLFGLVDLGMGMAVSKYLSESTSRDSEGRANEIISLATMFYFCLSIGLIVIVYSSDELIIQALKFEPIFDPSGLIVIKLVVFIFVLNLNSTIYNNILVAFEKWLLISVINIFFKILSGSALVIVVLGGGFQLQDKLIYIFIILLIVSALKMITLMAVSYNSAFNYKIVFPSAKTRIQVFSFLKISSYQYLLSLLVGHLDKFVISRYFGLESLGIYSFCVNVFSYLHGFISNMFKVYYPNLSNLHALGDDKILKTLFFKLMISVMLIALLLGTCVIVFWDLLISLYINQSFAATSFHLIPFFVVLLIVRSPEIVMHYFFNAIANPKVLVKNLLISTPITFCMYLILVPSIGVPGFMLSQILGFLILYFFHLLKLKRYGFITYAFER